MTAPTKYGRCQTVGSANTTEEAVLAALSRVFLTWVLGAVDSCKTGRRSHEASTKVHFPLAAAAQGINGPKLSCDNSVKKREKICIYAPVHTECDFNIAVLRRDFKAPSQCEFM